MKLFVIFIICHTFTILKTCDINNCSSCYELINNQITCEKCFDGFYYFQSYCRKCSDSLDNCLDCESNMKCNTCHKGYLLYSIDNTVSICISCEDAVENKICNSDCSNEECK